MIVCFDTCVDSIRTIPALQHDENRPEDVDTESEDHAADEWRYECMSRPWIQESPKAPEPARRLNVGFIGGATFDDVTGKLGSRRRDDERV